MGGEESGLRWSKPIEERKKVLTMLGFWALRTGAEIVSYEDGGRAIFSERRHVSVVCGCLAGVEGRTTREEILARCEKFGEVVGFHAGVGEER